jgi:arsenite oxidase small subunit
MRAANRFGDRATQNLPQYMLRVDADGTIYAEGIDELLYGRLSNVLL